MPISQIISPLENIPSTNDPSTFSAKADALLATELPDRFAELNTWASQANELAAAMNAAATGGALSIIYQFSTLTADADPGDGKLRLNAATQNLATTLYADLTDAAGSDWTAALDLFDDSTSATKGYIQLRDTGAGNKFLLFAVSGVTTASGYRKIVGSIAGSSAASPFANGESVQLGFSRTGDKGETGSGWDGGTVTNPITLPGDPASALQAAPKQYVDAAVAANSAGQSNKTSVRLVGSVQRTLSGLGTAVDGVTPSAGDRILLTAQSAPAENGIWIAASGAWSRASDMDAWIEFPGAVVWVEEGSSNADTGWVCTSNRGGALGTTAVAFTKFWGSGVYQTASATLTSLAGVGTPAALTAVGNVSTPSADKIAYYTGSSSASLTSLTSFARTLLGDVDAAAVLATLGVSGFVQSLLDEANADALRTAIGPGGALDKFHDAAPSGTSVVINNIPQDGQSLFFYLDSIESAGDVPGALVFEFDDAATFSAAALTLTIGLPTDSVHSGVAEVHGYSSANDVLAFGHLLYNSGAHGRGQATISSGPLRSVRVKFNDGSAFEPGGSIKAFRKFL